MTERPILFSGPLVRAILDGRKTVTRRVAKLTDAGYVKEPRGHRLWHPGDPEASLGCPYGQPGDTLWVKENYHLDCCHDPISPSDARMYEQRNIERRPHVMFAATPGFDPDGMVPGRLRPSIHMPRWASHIDLEVVCVRIERLHGITTADVRAEGVDLGAGLGGMPSTSTDARFAFADLWDGINGKRPGASWADNPWVWRVEFRRVKP